MRIVYIEWLDAGGIQGWHDRQAVIDDSSLPLCTTVGFVLHETDAMLVVAQNYDKDSDKVGETTSIPRSVIQFQQELSR